MNINTGEIEDEIMDNSMNIFNNTVHVGEQTIKNKEELVTKEEIISKNENNEEVDWLDLVAKNNDLKKFFTD